MLTQISIRNVVLIEKADLHFESGLGVLTGETGAGKSILLDALGLALGARGDSSLIRKGADSASVTASFDLVEDHPVFAMLQKSGVETESPLMLRRQISADGKSRGFINDEPVSLKILKEIGTELVEVHGQHEQQFLDNPLRQEALLDAYAGNKKEKISVSQAYADWRAKQEDLDRITEVLEQAARDREYIEHMERELSILKPKAGEEDELTERRTRMMQSEKLANLLDEVITTLQQPKSVSESLRGVERALTRSSLAQSPQFEAVVALLDQAASNVQEAEAVLEEIGRETAYSQDTLDTIEERLFALKDAARKYRIQTEELPALLADAREKLSALNTGAVQQDTLVREVAEARKRYIEAAATLSETRRKAAAKLEKLLVKELTPLKMEAALFKVDLSEKPESAWTARGVDSIVFTAAMNKGSDFAPLSDIASGGELSRFMLALAVVLGKASGTATMIFDEIDAGTGGAVADAIGRRLEELGQFTQVLVVTHLPQVAARGQDHFFISKAEKKKVTVTEVVKLTATQKREELARMLSGEEITEEARSAADRLLKKPGKDAA
ncbi:MAG: DNA repair protein RecN [Rickettsiales bacterium]